MDHETAFVLRQVGLAREKTEQQKKAVMRLVDSSMELTLHAAEVQEKIGQLKENREYIQQGVEAAAIRTQLLERREWYA